MKKDLLISLALFLVSFCLSAQHYPVPPEGHPRLFLREGDIPALKQNMKTPHGKEVLKKMEKLAVPRTPEEEAKVKKRDHSYYFKMRGLTSEVELRALDYLVSGNRRSARYAIVSILDSLSRTAYGTQMDLTRANGVMLMVGAMVYDWCYPELKASEKEKFIGEFKRIATLMECGWPPTPDAPVAGHPSEFMVMRDLLSAGIAIYDEDPEIYDTVMPLLMEKYVPVRQYLYDAGNYHQGTSYISTRFSSDLFFQGIMTKMGTGPVFTGTQGSVMYDYLYRSTPDGSLLRAGDDSPRRTFTMPVMLSAYLYKDPYLNWLYEQNTEMPNHAIIFDLLWYDPSIGTKAPYDLPLCRYSPSPFGWMIARTGWGISSVVAEMKINEQYAANHQHLDGGSFQIYYKGYLATDSGMYAGYNSDHSKYYADRTIAHNSLLVYDPDEKFFFRAHGGVKPYSADNLPVYANDGGQRMPLQWKTPQSFEEYMSKDFNVGTVLSHSIGDDFTCLKGDITAAYSDKVEKVERSFVFCDLHTAEVPAALVIFDRVVSRDPSFRKYFLLHCIEEPEISPGRYVVRKGGGMLDCRVLLPEKAEIGKVGGKGHEYDVFGTNFPIKDDGSIFGAWRVEVCPSQPAKEDSFLTVIQIADNGTGGNLPAERIDAGPLTGASFGGREVLFSKDGTWLGGVLSFPVPETPHLVLVTDLEPGEWKILCNGKLTGSRNVTQESRCLSFAAPAGVCMLIKA